MSVRKLLVLANQFGDVEDELIGDGVRVTRLTDTMRKQIYEQNTEQITKSDFYFGQENHALSIQYDPAQETDEEAEQEILRALVILRIIQPSSLGLHLVVTVNESPTGTVYSLERRNGIYTMAYVANRELHKVISREDIRRARVLWPNIKVVCQHPSEHRRIVRALRYYEIGCANIEVQIRHILFYSALECLLCICTNHLSQQILQRVMAVCPMLLDADVRDITKMRGGLAHSGSIEQRLVGREEELVQKLEGIVRDCLYHVLADIESVGIFSAEEKIKQRFPVAI